MNLSRPSVGFYTPVAFSQNVAIQNDFRFLNIDDLLKIVIRLAFVRFDNFPRAHFVVFTSRLFRSSRRYSLISSKAISLILGQKAR